ncbi:PAS domain S-box protein [Bdellovibrionota bacterium FG-1]
MTPGPRRTALRALERKNYHHTLGLLLKGISVGLTCWVLHALFDRYIFREVTFFQELLHPGKRELWIRIFITLGAAVFTTMYLRIRQVEQRLRVFYEVVEHAGDAVLLIDRYGHILYANKMATQRLGYSREELLQVTLADLDPVFSPLELEQVWESQRKGNSFQTDRHHRTKSGQLIPIEVVSKYVKLEGRGYLLAVVRDISERKAAQEALKKSQEALTLAQRIARIGSYDWNVKTGKAEFSDEIYHLLGVSEQDTPLTIELFLDFIHPADRNRVREALERDMRAKRPHASEHRIIQKRQGEQTNGAELWVHCQGEYRFDVAGNIVSMIGTVHDITERKKSELVQRESEERTRLLLESAGEGIIGIDLQGNCTFINPAGLKLLGFSDASSLLGQNLHQKAHHTRKDGSVYPSEECRAYLAFRKETHVHIDDEVFWRADGTSFDVEYQVQPLNHGDGLAGAVYVFSDISQRKRAEEALEKSADKLREANRLKDLFTDVLRHDLMNPATSMKLSSELLGKIETDPSKKKIVDTIRKSTENLIHLCETASRYAKVSGIEGIDFAESNLNSILWSTIREFQLQLDAKRIKIKYEPKPDCLVRANPMISDVFQNLISNAIKYSPEGSNIGIDVQAQDHGWVISVSDQGQGIPDPDKSRVFTRFERLDRESVKGTGLGLAIAKQIVALHGGKIWIEDNPGGGSVFRVQLPSFLELR